jgi:hypothetical protein
MLMLSMTLCFGMYSMNNKNLSVSFSNNRFFVFLKKEMGLRICMCSHTLSLSPARYFAPNGLQEEASCKEHEGQGSDGY